MLMELTLLIIALSIWYTYGYPSGAPVDVCEIVTPARLRDMLFKPQPSPYVMLQSTDSYKPGQVISVNLHSSSVAPSFKAFFIQALDKVRCRPVGRFLNAEGLTLMSECSGVMNDINDISGPRRFVRLAWVAPQDQTGTVVFRALLVIKKNVSYYEVLSRNENPSDEQIVNAS